MKKLVLSLVVLVVSSSSALAAGGFAAIAYSRSTAQWGEYHGAYDYDDAANYALSACGQSDCAVVNWVQNGYIAIAVGAGNHFGTSGIHDSAEDAADSALQNCENSTYNCVIKVQTSAFDGF